MAETFVPREAEVCAKGAVVVGGVSPSAPECSGRSSQASDERTSSVPRCLGGRA